MSTPGLNMLEAACQTNAGFRLTCRLPHCRFDDDICSTAQALLAAEGWPSGKQRQANRSIILPLCPPRQIADSWILFNSGAIAARWKAKAAWPLRAATLKQQAMITRRSGKAASGKLVWNQHKALRVWPCDKWGVSPRTDKASVFNLKEMIMLRHSLIPGAYSQNKLCNKNEHACQSEKKINKSVILRINYHLNVKIVPNKMDLDNYFPLGKL